MSTIISLCVGGQFTSVATDVLRYFPKSKITSNPDWLEIVLRENNSSESPKLIQKVARKLKNENFRFPEGSVLVVASFFDSAMTCLSLSPRDVEDLSLLNLGVEFVAYPCREPEDDDI
ncbi:MAG: hypothetical protein IJX22_02565 [Opitutales bacterium]|nr:hypothetical protein [Opitutales bacterium]